MAKKENDDKPVIIKRIKKRGGGHHGGAWKVAYADFVTAMMAFFLLLWLLNVTTDEQKAYISSYFAPADPRIASSMSGSGGVMGGTTLSPDGAQTSDNSRPSQQREPAAGVGREDGMESVEKAEAEAKLAEEMDRQDERAFREAEEKLRKEVEAAPELNALMENLIIDITPEGLRIQIVDQEGKPMFELGRATPLPHTRQLLAVVAGVVKDLPNRLSIRGHTDSKPYGAAAAYTNWELSSDRANAARRVMLGSGLDIARLENVQGKADREPLIENNPEDARNRRLSIILLKQSLVMKNQKKGGAMRSRPVPEAPKKKEDGVIYFP